MVRTMPVQPKRLVVHEHLAVTTPKPKIGPLLLNLVFLVFLLVMSFKHKGDKARHPLPRAFVFALALLRPFPLFVFS
jgi:hypothetical protein